jgi:hypothetical protein
VLVNITNTTDSVAYAFNVHGCETVLVTDTQGTMPAYSPIEEEWFCDGFAAYEQL